MAKNKPRKQKTGRKSGNSGLGVFAFFDSPGFLITVAVMIIAGIVFMYGKDSIMDSWVFKVRNVQSQINLDPGVQSSIMGKSIFKLNTQDIYYRIQQNHPEYKDISVVKQFPNTIVIDIKKRNPIAQIKAKRFYLVNQEGVILSDPANEPFMGFLSVELDDSKSDFSRGYQIRGQEFFQALELMKELKRKKIVKRFNVKGINASSLEAMSFIIAPIAVNSQNSGLEDVNIIIGAGDYERKLFIFDNVLKENLGNNISRVTYIDLRYKKAYLGYKR